MYGIFYVETMYGDKVGSDCLNFQTYVFCVSVCVYMLTCVWFANLCENNFRQQNDNITSVSRTIVFVYIHMRPCFSLFSVLICDGQFESEQTKNICFGLQ